MEKQISPEALIVRYLSNEATEAEQELLLDWVSRNANNQKIFQEFTQAWNAKTDLHAGYDVVQGLSRIAHVWNTGTERRTVGMRWYKVAAVIVFILTAVSTLLLTLRPSKQIHTITRITGAFERDTILLPDGTMAILNQKSSLTYPEQFTSHDRSVALKGEGYFIVAKDSLRPFFVNTGELTTKVLGTIFNIREDRHGIAITVVEGSVGVSHDSLQFVLQPSQHLVFDKVRKNISTTTVVSQHEVSWTTNTIYLRETTLAETVAMLSERYPVSFEIVNVNLKSCRVTGTFVNEPIENILEGLAFTHGIQWQQRGDLIVLTGSAWNRK